MLRVMLIAYISADAANYNQKMYNNQGHENRKVSEAVSRAFSNTFMVFLNHGQVGL